MTTRIKTMLALLAVLLVGLVVVVLVTRQSSSTPSHTTSGTCVFDPLLGQGGTYLRLAPGEDIYAHGGYRYEVDSSKCA